MSKVPLGRSFNGHLGFPAGSVSKESAHNAGDLGLIPGVGRASGEGNGNPLLDNSRGRRSWGAAVHGVANSRDTTE